ncbi:hypothetical protein RA19_13920 [Leisingera sp. ANG-M1]|uniref:hypothetical protein n=1 Tax=Leisingera sp. ANG-M1 TaxID=1577895 RepID=UPI00057F3555|nr:hypothetical protein [Leisingera sp. ANG-M1]KIC09856.1 hypothetical protein RA19_13920 [Leisingera sp. ANG-M1]
MRLQPWGNISVEREASAGPEVMTDWPDGLAAWSDYFDTKVQEFADNLWPRFDWETGNWAGKTAAFADEATKAELQICLERFQRGNILDQYPDTPRFDAMVSMRRTHMWHYRVEDFAGESHGDNAFEKAASRFPFSNIVYYDPAQNNETIWTRFVDLSKRKADGTFRFKLQFLRPRPYADATLFGMKDFKHHTATRYTHTGMHPAFPSGHCVQGLLICGGIIDDLLDTCDPGQIDMDALMQYAVDFGDRRVFGGVHYPTDNIASWVNAVHLGGKLFKRPEIVQPLIIDAITSKSTLYKVICDEFGKYEALQTAKSYLDAQLALAAEGRPAPTEG